MHTEREALDLIRAMATRSVPMLINLAAIDRILAETAPVAPQQDGSYNGSLRIPEGDDLLALSRQLRVSAENTRLRYGIRTAYCAVSIDDLVRYTVAVERALAAPPVLSLVGEDPEIDARQTKIDAARKLRIDADKYASSEGFFPDGSLLFTAAAEGYEAGYNAAQQSTAPSAPLQLVGGGGAGLELLVSCLRDLRELLPNEHEESFYGYLAAADILSQHVRISAPDLTAQQRAEELLLSLWDANMVVGDPAPSAREHVKNIIATSFMGAAARPTAIPVGGEASDATPALVPAVEQPVPGVMWVVVSCAPSRPMRYELPRAPRSPYARFETEAEGWAFLKGLGGRLYQTPAWEAAYHAVSPPTCDTDFCQICRDIKATAPTQEQKGAERE